MRNLWYTFIEDYKEEIPFKPLSVILEAFWQYCNGTKRNADKLMDR